MMMREPCAMSRRTARWKEVLQDLFALVCMLAIFAVLTVFGFAMVPA